MKYLIMTEGTCELALMHVLIEKGIFKIPVESFLYEKIYHVRQINGKLIEKIETLSSKEKITIIRIGDSLIDELKIPEEIEDRIEEKIKVCIKPEFEVLHLIYKEKIDDYIGKYKSLKKASEYLNQIDKKYQKTYDYNYDFFDSLTVNEIRNLIKRYSLKRKNTHKKDEGLLENLIK